jgi:2-oxoisovalerate dehydrogenase E1 component
MSVETVQARITDYLRNAESRSSILAPDDRISSSSTLTAGTALEIFEDQITSRLLDVKARDLKKRNLGFYTISSAGHEQNAVVGTVLRLADPCLLHYRSGAFMQARARKREGEDQILNTLLSLVASSDDPIAESRHKVWGSRTLWVPPQTSTIASHLPKAAGLAIVLRHARRAGKLEDLADDSIVCCSFGDASINHATALSGINAALYTVRRGGTAPILFVCEDNGIGISVDTPKNWVHDSFSNRPHLEYFNAEGAIDDVWNVVLSAVDACRRSRRPVFLRLASSRLWGHAGTDVETTYRTPDEIEAEEAKDPILLNARRLLETGAATGASLIEVISALERRIDATAKAVIERPKLRTVEEVIKPLAPFDEERCRSTTRVVATLDDRSTFFGSSLPEDVSVPSKRTLGAHINSALADEMLRFPEVIVFGEDVGRKGGVYYVTAGLQKRFGPARVFDTLLDETTILGVAQGAGLAGLLPVPEIQYLAYIHNALDQLRGEACSLHFFSAGQFSNPMVVRIAGLAYQKGFGGHFHNDNSIGALRDIPGLILAVPSRGDDAAKMLRGCISVARECGRVVAFLEPIALYHEKDLYKENDGGWLFDYPPPPEMLLPGEAGVYDEDASDLLIVSYGNGLRLSLRAAATLRAEKGVRSRILDVRWLNPLPFDAIATHARSCPAVLVADECRATGGGIADAVIASLAEGGYSGRVASVRSIDTYVPIGPAANLVLISEEQIVRAASDLLAMNARP